MSAPDISALLRTFEEAQGANSVARQAKQKAAELQSANSAGAENMRQRKVVALEKDKAGKENLSLRLVAVSVVQTTKMELPVATGAANDRWVGR